MTHIIMMVWLATQCQIFSSVKSSGSQIALLRTKLVEVMEFQLSYLKILKYDAVKVLHSTCQQIWKTQQWPQDCKSSLFIPIPKKGDAKKLFKMPHNCTHLTCQQSNAKNSPSEVQQYMNQEFPHVQGGFRKGTETRHQIANIRWIKEKSEVIPEKNLLLLH